MTRASATSRTKPRPPHWVFGIPRALRCAPDSPGPLLSLTIARTCTASCSSSHHAPRLSGFRFRVQGEINRWHVFPTCYFDHPLIVLDPALVEQVRDGSTLRVRLFMPNGDHQMINIALAGVRCARTSSKPDEPSEPWAEEVRSLVCMPNPRAKPV